MADQGAQQKLLQVLQLSPQVAPEQARAVQFGPPYSSLRPEQNPPATCRVAASLNTRIVSRPSANLRRFFMGILLLEHVARAATACKGHTDAQWPGIMSNLQ
jgi:hypothetical protein